MKGCWWRSLRRRPPRRRSRALRSHPLGAEAVNAGTVVAEHPGHGRVADRAGGHSDRRHAPGRPAAPYLLKPSVVSRSRSCSGLATFERIVSNTHTLDPDRWPPSPPVAPPAGPTPKATSAVTAAPASVRAPAPRAELRLAAGAKFCTNCGTPAVPGAGGAAMVPAPAGDRKAWGVAAAVSGVLLVAVLVLVMRATAHPRQRPGRLAPMALRPRSRADRATVRPRTSAP